MSINVKGASTKQLQVEEAGQRIRRYYCAVKETMRAMAGYLPTMALWEPKKLLARHIWLDAMHAEQLRNRTLDLRYPRVDVDNVSDANLVGLLRQLPCQRTDLSFLHVIYEGVKPLLLKELHHYLEQSDPLDDAPSHVYLRRIIDELKLELAEYRQVKAQLPDVDEPVCGCDDFIIQLNSCGGIQGPDQAIDLDLTIAPYVIPVEAGRDPQWEPAVMQVAPRDPLNFMEHQVWIAIDHANEVWASETPAALIWEYPHAAWSLVLGAARWCYDEMRHAMMGEQRLQALGLRMGIDTPMVPDHWRVFRERGVGSLLLLLHGLEQGGPLHKAKLRKLLTEADDLQGAQDCDYDWADESNHLAFGFAWIKALYPQLSKAEIMEQTQLLLREWQDWMKAKHRDGTHGYELFMERIEAVTLAG